MFRFLARQPPTRAPHRIIQLHIFASRIKSSATRRSYGIHLVDPGTLAACKHDYCVCERMCREYNPKLKNLKALGAEMDFPKYDPSNVQQINLMEEWYARGPPPLSEYTLSFGKHRGKRLDQVPDMYLVKYLIPRRTNIYQCPMVAEVIADFMKTHPDIKSQAGRKKTIVRKGGIAARVPKKRVWNTDLPVSQTSRTHTEDKGQATLDADVIGSNKDKVK